MKIKQLLTNLKRKIEELDCKARIMDKVTNYSTNPFAFNSQKTYVWIEKPDKQRSKAT